MKHLPSALSAARLAVIAALVALIARPALGQATTATFVQGSTFSTGSRVLTTSVTLTSPVAGGDLLVGWFSQYNVSGQVQVSDNVNGAWTRASASLHFLDDTGDIALYYHENSQAAPSGMTITVSVSSTAYLQGTVADYSGVALAGSLDQIVSARGQGTVVDTGASAAVDAGELVFAALVTSPAPGSVTPGSSLGVPYTARAQTSNGSAFEEDITSSAAGAQQGTASLGAATDWYAVGAVFHPYPATPPVPPSTPTGLNATSVASTRVAVAWSPSTGSVAGYTVYRGGSAIGTTGPNTTTFLDPNVTRATTYTYSVDAFDLANDRSARSASLTVKTPAASPEFVQGAAASPADRLASYTFTLSQPILANDLLVGWFGQYNAPGQVQVSDNINGPWTQVVSLPISGTWSRGASTTFSGTGDIALFYREHSAAAPFGLAITLSASAPAYLQGAVANYRFAAPVGALDQAVVSQGVGTYANVGPTPPIPAGELVVAAVITGGQPGSATAGSSQMVPYLIDAQNGSASSDLEDILSSAGGPQEGSMTLGSATNWYMVLATFRPLTMVGLLGGPPLP
ncbi:MAG: fibronectin type III domain-containing protein [Deltaproteobacteria bacterium]|nr:MAG: fibronectin type III domain-containing protein [Deltaproteobacteria bacterium]